MALFKPKTSKTDYTQSMLPQNRKEVFFDVVKMHFWKLLICGFILLLFALPLHFTDLLTFFYQAGLYEKLVLEELDVEEVAFMMVSFSNFMGLINILLYMLFAVGLAGVARVIKLLAWEENAFLRYDFFAGIRQNASQYVLLGFIVGLLAFICRYVNNLSTLVEGNIYGYLGIIPTVLCMLLLAPVAAYMTVCIAVYNNKFLQNSKICFVLYFKDAPKTLLACLCCFAVFIVQLIPNFYCHLIGRIVASILIPFVMLGWFLFAFNALDKTVNNKFYPELIGKGVTEVSPDQKVENIITENLEEIK